MSEPNGPEQDINRAPRVRLRVLLALLRLLGGRRGWSSVTWSGQGYTYRVSATRADPGPFALDRDPSALHGGEAESTLRGHLGV